MRVKLAIIVPVICFIATIIYIKSVDKSDPNEIRIGMMSGWAPFMSINNQGKFEGFDVDVANEIALRLGKICKILDMGSLAPLFVALETNKIDMILSGLDMTEERMNKMNMTAYSGDKVDTYSLLFWQKIPDNITSLEDLKHYPNPVIVVEPGVSAEKLVNSYDFIIKKPIATLADRLLDLQYGKSLAMLLEPTVARSLIRKNGDFLALPIKLPPELCLYGMGTAVKKENTAFADKIKNIIAAMKQDGTLKRLEAKWRLDEDNDEV